MKERIKTILLFSLVFLSLFLTQKLWIQLPNRTIEMFKAEKAFSTSYALSDMISPNKYLLNFGNKNHTLINDDTKYTIWNNSRNVLSEVIGSKSTKVEEISKEQYLKLQEERSLVFYFPEKINSYILSKTWDVKDPNIIVDTISGINDIYIYLGNGDPFFVFSDKEKYLMAYDKNIDNTFLKQELTSIESSNSYNYYYSMREIYNIDNDIYMPYKIENKIPIVYVNNKIITLNGEQKKQLVEKVFLKDIDYVREIVESNGSTIYEYNNRVLKLNNSGTLEYFHALEEPKTERNFYISLLTVAEFITEKTFSQKGIYLSDVEEIKDDVNLGYKMTFKYRIRGIPVLLGNRDVVDYIEIEVFYNQIRSFKQLARSEMDIGLNNSLDNRTMLSSFDVLDKNYEYLEAKHLISNNMIKEDLGEDIVSEILSSIDDISLSYYDPNLKDKEERLIEVWAISIDNKVYGFNAYTGKLVFER